jgi:catechol 2,3-dioxygenase-like lactoylglutathione lyase family enzyme
MTTIGFRHVGIVVDDMELQRKFYEQLLGLECYYDQVESGEWLHSILKCGQSTCAHIVKLGKNNATMVELLHFNEWVYRDNGNAKGYNEVGITHMALTVKNLEGLYRAMEREKVHFISPPHRSPDDKVNVCFCHDYEGNLVELVEVVP